MQLYGEKQQPLPHYEPILPIKAHQRSLHAKHPTPTLFLLSSPCLDQVAFVLLAQVWS